MERKVKIIEGARHARRPSSRVKSEGLQYAADKFKGDEFVGNRDDWAITTKMPDERAQEDIGWKPGPIPKELPVFNGPARGPTDSPFDDKTTATAIMDTQITPRFKAKVREHSKQHVLNYRADHLE